MVQRGKRARKSSPPVDDPGGGQGAEAQPATTKRRKAKKQKIDTVDQRALDAVDTWFDHTLARQLWMPTPAETHQVSRRAGRDGVCEPLLKSWFDLSNVADVSVDSTSIPRHAQLASSKLGSAGADDKPPPNAVVSIRLHPTTQQRAKLQHMFSTSRDVYNKLVALSMAECAPHYCEERGRNVVATLSELGKKYHYICQADKLRKFFRNPKRRRWHQEVLEEVRVSGFRDFMKAVRSSRALYVSLKGKGKATSYPELKFKSRFKLADTIELRARSVSMVAKDSDTRLRFHPTFFGFLDATDGIQIRQPLPALNYSVRLQRLREGEFNLLVPLRRSWPPVETTRVCAIDPGVINFITVYDPSGRTVSVTDGSATIKRRFEAIDAMKSELSKLENEQHGEPRSQGDILRARRQRYRLRRRIRYTNRRVTRMVTDMHHKVASWLAANYCVVLLPTFQTSTMVKKYEDQAAADGVPASSAEASTTTADTAGAPLTGRGKRKIRSSTARSMLSQRHYQFRMLLKYKMDRVGGVLVECTEEYTSQTCSACGELNVSLGGSRDFRCQTCRGHFDRDINAARNILMKNWPLLQ